MRRIFMAATLACSLHITAQAPTDTQPTFTVPQAALSEHTHIIVYGDQRFTTHIDVYAANARARQALVAEIARRHPDAVQMNGDVPYAGFLWNDYEVYFAETAAWRAEKLRVYPALGNHELTIDPERGLRNWWRAFPELDGKRWYSVRLGDRIQLFQLDSLSPFTADSLQQKWLREQLVALPPTVDFVLISLHHPPVADVQVKHNVDHNPRPNEIALRTMLDEMAPHLHAAFLISSGHIHNYERREINGIQYVVTGGGGARPLHVDRTPDDLYQDPAFPVFNFVELTLEDDRMKAVMVKIADPNATQLKFEEKDHFELKKKTATPAP